MNTTFKRLVCTETVRQHTMRAICRLARTEAKSQNGFYHMQSKRVWLWLAHGDYKLETFNLARSYEVEAQHVQRAMLPSHVLCSDELVISLARSYV